MVTVALPLWLMVVIGLALVVLLVGASYGLVIFIRQLMDGQVDFEGAMPLNEFTTVARDRPELNPRLRGVDPHQASELIRQAKENPRRGS